MINLAAMHRVRKHPAFAAYFAAVLPIFWPVVFWYLLRVADQMDAHGNCDVLVIVHWWGGIEITQRVDHRAVEVDDDATNARDHCSAARIWSITAL